MISVIKYCLGFLKNLFNPGVSLFSIVDKSSSISPKARIYRGVKVYDSNIEAYTYVTPKTEINWTNIGKFCSISSYCCIGLGMHAIQNISTSPIFISIKNSTGHQWTQCNTFVESQRIFIGNDVWIGARVMVKCGVKIGNGAIVGAGSIVTKDIPDYAIVVGVPARVIRYRFENDVINRLNEIKWWDLPEYKLKENIGLFQKEDITLSELERIAL